MKTFFYRNKYGIMLLANTLVSALAYLLAFQVRFLDNGLGFTKDMLAIFLETLGYSILVDLLFMHVFRLLKIVLRYTNLDDLMRVLKSVTCSAVGFCLLIYFVRGFSQYPRSIFVLRFIFGILAFSSLKVSRRVIMEFIQCAKGKHRGHKTIIVGAGDIGDYALREIRRKYSGEFHLVGFLDDDPRKQGNTIGGYPVLGSCRNAAQIIHDYGITEVIIAIPDVSKHLISSIVEKCGDDHVNFKILPSFHDALTGKLHQEGLREVKVEDLLGRDAITLDKERISAGLAGKSILITGAGGSIGSELVRQIARFNPAKLILFEVSESPLFEINREIRAAYPDLHVVPFIGDIKHPESVDFIFEREKPDRVYHAAAYKHVPLMEEHPDEAVLTNVMGTLHLFEAAIKHHVDRVVMLSTDKAVRPTNVMGASKRCAELMISHFNNHDHAKTKFSAVRFGNVLGSNGSVVPIFRKQIASGGPITITHPDITRYFMTIPEAAELVLQAGALGDTGEVFILDMGEPVKIVDLAKNMIELSGLKVDRDIKLEFIGLRPGEKLHEELVAYGEDVEATRFDKIRVQKARQESCQFDIDDLTLLIGFAKQRDVEKTKDCLWETVGKYDPDVCGARSTGGS